MHIVKKHTISEIRAGEEKLNFLNLLILFLSVYVIFELIIETFAKVPAEVSRTLHYIDNFICLVFFYEFVVRFRSAKNKVTFMKWGWIDLLACIPITHYMRLGSLRRLIRVLRMLRAFRSFKYIYHYVFKNKIQGTLTSVALFSIAVLLFSTIAILQVEVAPNSNIKTAEDAIWWSYVTITGVGYGDKYPITSYGRLIAAFLMTVGLGLFGTLTAYIASWFVKENIEEEIEK